MEDNPQTNFNDIVERVKELLEDPLSQTEDLASDIVNTLVGEFGLSSGDREDQEYL